MDTETETNPVEGDDTSFDETEAFETEVETDEPETDDDGNPIEEPEPGEPEEEFEEIERDGRKAKVPAWLKPELMMQSDYTRKTQELAEQRKSFEAERQSLQQATEAEIRALAQAQGTEAEIAKYQNVDWDAWYEEDPFEAQKAESRLRRLNESRQQAVQQFSQLRQQRTLYQQQEAAKLVAEGRAVLSKEIPGWSEDLARSLLDTGVKEYGFARDEIEEFTDPRMVKVLHDAHQYRKQQVKQKAVQNHTAAQQVKPAGTVKARTAPPSGLDDRLSAEEWARRRNAQVRKRA